MKLSNLNWRIWTALFCQTSLKTITAVLNLMICGTAFAAQDPSLNSPLGYEMNQVFIFKKPLIVPFGIVPEKMREDIEKGPPAHFTVTFTAGQAIRIADVFDEPQLKFDHQTSMQKSGQAWHSNPAPDITFCAVTLKLTSEKNQTGYVVRITPDILPYAQSRRESLSLGFGTMTNQTFGGYVELKDSERPNPQTANGTSSEIPMFVCHRHAKGNTGVRARDFVNAMGEENVQLRTRKFVRIRGKVTIQTSPNNALIRGKVIELSPGIDRKNAEEMADGFETYLSTTSGNKLTDCEDAEVTLSASYGNFIPRPGNLDVYNAPKILDFQCHST